MRSLVRILGVLGILLLPSAVFAQASIIGVAKDSSGAVLPGVTVEAASPVLIEKVRSTVTDGNGRYQLVDLRPGAYTVTFTLTGFNTVKRDGVVLSGSATVQVDGDMRVGALEETITVTGEAPVVDVQTTTRQSVLSSETIDALPTSRNYAALARLIPGTQSTTTDVGGSQIQDVGGSVTVHGSKSTDQRVTLNGINTMTLQAGGNIGGQIPDLGSASEVTVDTSSLAADLPTGGVRINFVPRDGGNRLSSSTFFTASNESMQGNNFGQELRDQGLAAQNKIDYNYDINESLGGPFKRDKIWFWFSTRYNAVSNFAPVLANANAFKVNEWLYAPIAGEQGNPQGWSSNNSIRVTWQINQKNKLAGTYKADKWCNCPDNISATTAPEAGRDRRFPRLRQEHMEWTAPVTSRVLAEAVFMHLFERWGNMHLRVNGGSLDSEAQEAAMLQMISVNDQGLNLTYRAGTTFNNTHVPNFAYRGAVSYITGTHAIKTGFNRTHGFLHAYNYALQPVSYRFNNGVPNQITQRALPHRVDSNMDNDLGLYVQDRWSLDRLTINGAVRFDLFQTSYPEQHLGPTFFTPTRNVTFPAQDHLNWKDISYRSGFSYDLFGNGRTAIKGAINKYLLGQTLNGIAGDGNPINTLVTSTTRNWTDADADFTPDCDLFSPLANGECQAISNTDFGSVVTSGETFDPALISGWGTRPSNWEFTASVQHEILPRVSVDVGYFRRIWQNFRVTDNLAVDASDFDTFDVKAPVDARLPGGGGQTIPGLRNLKAASFGRPDRNFNTLDRNFGGQKDHYDGVDVTVNGRLRNGLTFQFGTSTGTSMTDNCAVRAALPELNVTQPLSRCHQETPLQTDVKGYATYIIPGVDVQTSATYRRTTGPELSANFTMNNAYLASNSTLGRNLAGGGNSNISVNLLEPNTLYRPGRNELDLRFGKVLRFGRARSVLSVDIFNALNNAAVTSYNGTFALPNSAGVVLPANFWPRPTALLNARLLKLSVNVDF